MNGSTPLRAWIGSLLIASCTVGALGCNAEKSRHAEQSPATDSLSPEKLETPAQQQDASSFNSSASDTAFSNPEIPSRATAAPTRSRFEITAAESVVENPTASAIEAPFDTLPSGSEYSAESGFATIRVFYATDRAQDELPMSAYRVTGARGLFFALIMAVSFCSVLALMSLIRGRSTGGAIAGMGAMLSAGMIAVMLSSGKANVEKEGVQYTADRGILTRGIAEVTVPDTHQRGELERPSLLRFEFSEDQSKHIVLTSAKELGEVDFYRRLSTTVDESPEQDLLVFIHGYNVDFESAIQRTAQLAVDLPFRGVPVCYSWPSQGQILGYTIDENNSAWTVSHLKTFLYELAERSQARSINVIAHSMGTRALTSALSEISYEIQKDQSKLFDRVVLAAPDIDADQFRRDLAPRVLRTSSSVTLYASSNDNALIASKQVHGYPRAGESGPQLVVVPGIETVDVSGVDLSLLGHSYYGDSRVILGDLFQLVHDGLPASQRPTLEPRDWSGLMYWQLNANWLADLGVTLPR